LCCRASLWYHDPNRNVAVPADHLLEGILTVNVETNGEAVFSSLKIMGVSILKDLVTETGTFCLQFQLLEKTDSNSIDGMGNLEGEIFSKHKTRTLDIRVSSRSKQYHKRKRSLEEEEELDIETKKIKAEYNDETDWKLVTQMPSTTVDQQNLVNITTTLPIAVDPSRIPMGHTQVDGTDNQSLQGMQVPSSPAQQPQGLVHGVSLPSHWSPDQLGNASVEDSMTPQQARLQQSQFISRIQDLLSQHHPTSQSIVMPVSPPVVHSAQKQRKTPKKESKNKNSLPTTPTTPISSQAGKVDITHLLTYPQSQAAATLDMSNATFSKRFRQANNNKRWPYRALQVVEKQLKEGRSKDPNSGNIQQLEDKRKSLLAPAFILVKK